MSFYRAALSTARLIDHENDHRVLDPDADAAWRAYGNDLPTVVRCDLVLRNFAMLYPAAFAPGPVFGLAGWYDDDPWGTGFERPAASLVEGLFAACATPPSAALALEQALAAWDLSGQPAPSEAGDTESAGLHERISPTTNLVVAGARATAAVARAFVRGERLSARSQVVLVSERPESRHALGIACALLREAGVPLLANLHRAPDEPLGSWASREKQRLGMAQARLLVVSPDTTATELSAAKALAEALGADETVTMAGK
jgi:hypothetical protein